VSRDDIEALKRDVRLLRKRLERLERLLSDERDQECGEEGPAIRDGIPSVD
jgi:hypothetical protein